MADRGHCLRGEVSPVNHHRVAVVHTKVKFRSSSFRGVSSVLSTLKEVLRELSLNLVVLLFEVVSSTSDFI